VRFDSTATRRRTRRASAATSTSTPYSKATFNEWLHACASPRVCFRYAGATQEAEEEIRKAAPGRAEDPILLYSNAIVSAAEGRRRDALRIANDLETRSRANGVPVHLIAGIHAMLGDDVAATTWLERGVETGSIPMFYKDSAIWSRLRGSAQFTSLLLRMGVPTP
jgi:hypothetical protein